MAGSSVFLGWYYEQDGRKLGPINLADLVRLTQAGQLQPTDRVWKAYRDSSGTYLYEARVREAIGHQSDG
jgi:hypothetical protein